LSHVLLPAELPFLPLKAISSMRFSSQAFSGKIESRKMNNAGLDANGTARECLRCFSASV
jgi:hypothetical protein